MLRPLTIVAAVCALAVPLAACQSEDVTGEPEDIRTLVHLVSDQSGCDRSADGDLTFRVRLSNTGEDERTVTITPVTTDSTGDEQESSLDSFKVTVPGHDEAAGELLLDSAPGADDLASCAIKIDGHDPEPVERRTDDG